MTKPFNHSALSHVLRAHRVDDLAADIARHPYFVDLHLAVGVHAEVGDMREVSAMAVLERYTHPVTFWQLGSPRPIGLLRNRFKHAFHPGGIEAVIRFSQLRSIQEI